MNKWHYYNEFDPFVAQWLRNLISEGLIPDGEVDERSIADVHADDVRKFIQCHFFAGIGGFPLALRLAGFPEDRNIWTGSCPCQPFSIAGKGKGAADERHLWPHLFRLISECRPTIAIGEQVAGKAGLTWLDGVFADLDAANYHREAFNLSACSVNSPHIRQRLYWFCKDMGKPNSAGWNERQLATKRMGYRDTTVSRGSDSRYDDVADTRNKRSQGRVCGGKDTQRKNIERYVRRDGAAYSGSGLADTSCEGRQQDTRSASGHEETNRREGWHINQQNSDNVPTSNGEGNFWANSIWLKGSDGKTRRAPWLPQSGFCGLANGIPEGMVGLRPSVPLLTTQTESRAGKLKALGNAIVPPLAAEFIKAIMDTNP